MLVNNTLYCNEKESPYLAILTLHRRLDYGAVHRDPRDLTRNKNVELEHSCIGPIDRCGGWRQLGKALGVGGMDGGHGC